MQTDKKCVYKECTEPVAHTLATKTTRVTYFMCGVHKLIADAVRRKHGMGAR